MLSVLYLSCRRRSCLERTIDGIRAYFQEIEPDVPVQWICLDNGSSTEDRRWLGSLDFDSLILSRLNIGIGPAMNRLIASVRTPYFLNLQDDWLIENPGRVPFVRESLRILDADPKIAQIKLDAHHFLNFDDRATYDGPFRAQGQGIEYYVQNPGMLWGGFTFPPAITRTEAVLMTGPFREDQPFRRGWAESEFSARFSQKYVVAKSPQMVLFKHIGDEATSGWKDAAVGDSKKAASATASQDRDTASRAPLILTPKWNGAKGKIACLLTAFGRPKTLETQLAAVRGQTTKPSQIAVWQNFNPKVRFDDSLLNQIPNVRSTNCNFGVWPRFNFCQEFDAEFICVFDDDTIPGKQWLENCMETMRKQEGLLGANGVIFTSGQRGPQVKVGWVNPVNDLVEVDIVGHAWFFRKEWLAAFATEPRRGHSTCGEDYHFSVAIQMLLGLGTYVPPHAPNDQSGWGSIQGNLGQDKVALYLQEGEDRKKEETHNAYLEVGWKPIALRKKIVADNTLTSESVVREPQSSIKPKRRLPFAGFEFQHDFTMDFDKIDIQGPPFAFVRFADGELALCTGRPIRGSDGWDYDGGDHAIAMKLREAVRADLPGLYMGISCRCCDANAHEWYRDHLRTPLTRVSFSNLFVNANYERFKKLNLSNTVLVASTGGDFRVPANALEVNFNMEELLEALFKVDRPILVAAGPLGKVLIFEYWMRAPNPQVIVDIGSALDPIIHGRPTRGYHNPVHPNARKVCVW